MADLRQRAFLPVLFFVGAVVAIVSSMGAPLIPALAEQLNVSIGAAQWALTATLVVAAVTSPLVSRLGDGRLRKRMIVGGLAVVVVGGAMAALASSLAILIVGRGLQGLGYAMLPLTMATARDHLPAPDARKAIATLSVMGAAGVGLGYPLSGLIADHGGVSAAYWFGAAVSFVALLFAVWALPNPANPPAKQPLDIPGAALIGFGLVVLLIALDKAPDYGWADPWIVASICVGLLSLAVWAFYELRVEHPLVNLRLMKHRPVLTANITGLLISVIMYLALVTISQLVLNPTFGFGATIFVTGLTIVPLSVLQQRHEPVPATARGEHRDPQDHPARWHPARRGDAVLRGDVEPALAGVRDDGHSRSGARLHVRGDAGADRPVGLSGRDEQRARPLPGLTPDRKRARQRPRDHVPARLR